MSLKVLIIGQGGREHALVHALSKSPTIREIHAIPGSDGMSREALCHNLDFQKHDLIIDFCLRMEIDYVFIGPEDPLVQGLSDSLRDRGILVVGPSKEAAQLEGSKIFAKKFMAEAKIPTAKFSVVSSVIETMKEAPHFSAPYVLKADGLAAGKGVFICKTLQDLENAARDIFEKKILGSAGETALLEQFMPGWELSYLLITNGSQYQALPLAQDHKRLQDNDEGPNTGGMGTVAPLKIDPALLQKIEKQIVAPTIQSLKAQNILYRGVLFLGLMITDQGPQLLEYNCRLGDPETQVILPLIDGDLGQIFYDLSIGKLQNIKQKNIFASCIVMASPGYPFHPEKNVPITGDPLSSTDSTYFLHAGSKKDPQGHWVTNGGRVLNSVALGNTREESLEKAYEQTKKAHWMGLQKRSDIGKNLA